MKVSFTEFQDIIRECLDDYEISIDLDQDLDEIFWDSLAALSFMSIVDERYQILATAEAMEASTKVQHLFEIMS